METKGRMGALAPFGVFTLFALVILSVLLSGASAYHRLVEENQIHDNSRTALSYISARVRRAESGQNVQTETFAQGDALILLEQLDGQSYTTRIYCYEGYLMELYTPKEGTFAPQDGTRILPMEALEVTIEGGLLTVTLEDEKQNSGQIALYLPGSEVTAP